MKSLLRIFKKKTILSIFIGILIFLIVFTSGTFFGWILSYNKGLDDGKLSQRKAAVEAGYYREDSGFLNYTPLTPEDKNWQNNKITQSGWIPYWNFKNGTNSYYANPDQFVSLSPVWYDLKSDGSIDAKSTYANPAFLSYAKRKGTKIIPSVSNFHAEVAKIVVKDQQSIDRFIGDLMKEVNTYDFDGIDMDWEEIEFVDKDGFLKLMKQLGNELHKKNKVLTVAVVAKYTDLDIYAYLKQTRRVLDYEDLGKIVDEVRLMTYGYTPENGYNSGPVAPIEWVESVAQYAVTKVPKDKLVLGIPLYGNGWDTKGGPGIAYTYEQIKDKLPASKDTMEETTKENLAELKIKDELMTVWFSDQNSVNYRRNIAKKYGFKGVIYWSLGGEDQKIWSTTTLH